MIRCAFYFIEMCILRKIDTFWVVLLLIVPFELLLCKYGIFFELFDNYCLLFEKIITEITYWELLFSGKKKALTDYG